LSTSLVGIVITHGERFPYSNAKFDDMFGSSAEELRHMGPLAVVAEAESMFEHIRSIEQRIGSLEGFVREQRKTMSVVSHHVEQLKHLD